MWLANAEGFHGIKLGVGSGEEEMSVPEVCESILKFFVVGLDVTEEVLVGIEPRDFPGLSDSVLAGDSP